MINPSALDELSRRIGELLPPGVEKLGTDFRRNLRAAVGTAVSRMDLVTREEFDLQAAVLARTREKLETLERRVAALEPGRQGATPHR